MSVRVEGLRPPPSILVDVADELALAISHSFIIHKKKWKPKYDILGKVNDVSSVNSYATLGRMKNVAKKLRFIMCKLCIYILCSY